MHIGSFTPQGTFEAAAARLGHVAGAGFTAVQLMPITEHSDAWGYNPRQARPRRPHFVGVPGRQLVCHRHVCLLRVQVSSMCGGKRCASFFA